MQPTPQPPETAQPDLTTVVTDVLGDLAFMVTDDEAPELPAGTVWLLGEVRYSGPRAGVLRCWCTRDFATQLAANLLGIEPREGEAQVAAEDSVREFMNVLCGQLVTTWYGTESVFNVSIPQVCERADTPRLAESGADAWCQLSLDGEPLLCTHHRES